MAKKSVVQRNLKRIIVCGRYKDRRDELKFKIKDKNLTINEKVLFQAKLTKLCRDSSPIRVRNRCFLTGRPRGVYRKFGLSRVILRDLCAFGKIPGVTKSSW
ncbi:30S ribosomal protein S14 [Wolbachia endosymbiont of Pentidionis agamae]|uniref:30S ribosomal protein S14 n=1 Tax=Wolbachia endosymbiont of Pentidionis agamae TaxID=3110435 RepID=UPI002FD24E38